MATVQNREKIRKTPRKFWEQLKHKAMGSQVKAVRLGKQKGRIMKNDFKKIRVTFTATELDLGVISVVIHFISATRV